VLVSKIKRFVVEIYGDGKQRLKKDKKNER